MAKRMFKGEHELEILLGIENLRLTGDAFRTRMRHTTIDSLHVREALRFIVSYDDTGS